MKKIVKFFKLLGPGFITGASDDDPAGIATYAQTGALFGFSQAWTALFSFPLMSAVQEMCGRIGLVTGKGLAGVIKKNYSKKILYPIVSLLVLANVINIGADIGVMASSAQLLYDLPFLAWLIIFVFVTILLEVSVPYRIYSQYLKFLAFALLAYVFTAFVIIIDWQKVLFATFTPYIQLSPTYLMNIVAILGTTISPYLFFWQASEEVEEEVVDHKLREMGAGIPKTTTRDITKLRKDTLVGMLFSNLVMWFIIIVTGATLFPNGVHEIQSATQAASVLRPLAGDAAFLLFAVGIIGTGLLAIPVLAGSASYAVSEAFGWKEGLYRNWTKARGFYAVIILTILAGFFTNFLGINPIQFLYYSAVINGMIAPILLFFVVLIANDKNIMGKWVNSSFLNVLGIGTVIIMSFAAIALIASLIKIG